MEKPNQKTLRPEFDLVSRQKGGYSGWIVSIGTALTPIVIFGGLFVAEPTRTTNMFASILGFGNTTAKAATFTHTPR